jgi:hypothetical protein
MNNALPVDISLEHYNELLKVKPRSLQSKYPFSAMDEEDVTRTLKQIELVYQNLTPELSAFVRKDDSNGKPGKQKKGGDVYNITVFTT